MDTNTKEFEVTGISRSGRVRKKSSKLLDFQSPDEVEKKNYKRTTHSPKPTLPRYASRGRPSLATIKARRAIRLGLEEENDMAVDDEEPEEKPQNKEDLVVDNPSKETADEEEEDDLDEDDINEVLQNSSGLTAATDSDDDGFGELVADFVGSEGTNLHGSEPNQKSHFRQSLYMAEKNKIKENRLERKDKGKARYTAYNMWAREHRKFSKNGKTNDMDYQAARRLHELWSNVSNKEKNAWKRKAKMQATRAQQKEKSEVYQMNKSASTEVDPGASNSTFINRPTTSRTKKLAEDKQKAKDESTLARPTTPSTSTPKKTRNNSYRKSQTNTSITNNSDSSPLYIATNGSVALNNTKTILPTIEPIDAAAHLKLLGESLSIIGERLKEHEGQIAVSGSLSVLLDSILCSLGPLLCLTTLLPGLDKKPQLKANLATTLDNIAYVMPGL